MCESLLMPFSAQMKSINTSQTPNKEARYLLQIEKKNQGTPIIGSRDIFPFLELYKSHEIQLLISTLPH
jgi:hypothetical protein